MSSGKEKDEECGRGVDRADHNGRDARNRCSNYDEAPISYDTPEIQRHPSSSVSTANVAATSSAATTLPAQDVNISSETNLNPHPALLHQKKPPASSPKAKMTDGNEKDTISDNEEAPINYDMRENQRHSSLSMPYRNIASAAPADTKIPTQDIHMDMNMHGSSNPMSSPTPLQEKKPPESTPKSNDLTNDDDRLHAHFVLAYLRQKGLMNAAADVQEWIDSGGGGKLPANTGTTNAKLTDNDDIRKQNKMMDEDEKLKEEARAVSASNHKQIGTMANLTPIANDEKQKGTMADLNPGDDRHTLGGLSESTTINPPSTHHLPSSNMTANTMKSDDDERTLASCATRPPPTQHAHQSQQHLLHSALDAMNLATATRESASTTSRPGALDLSDLSTPGAHHVYPTGATNNVTSGPSTEDGLGRNEYEIGAQIEEAAPSRRRRSSRLSVGSVRLMVTATAVDDVVVEASIIEDARKGTKRRKLIEAAGLVLTIVAVIALSVSLGQGPAANDEKPQDSSIPDDVKAILELQTGEACVNTNPTYCACYSGHDYNGTVNETTSGKTCQAWNSHEPHDHGFFNVPSIQFPLLGENNYCRNPDHSAGAWCYTTDPETRWEYCNVPQCETYTVNITLSTVPDPPLPPRDPRCSTSQRQTSEQTSGLYLNGNSTFVNFLNSTTNNLNLDGSGAFTIEAWVKPQKKLDFNTILSNKEAGAAKSGFLFAINTWQESNGRLYFEGTYSQVATVQSVQWDKWQHIAVTYDGSVPAFFLDGVPLAYYPIDFYSPFVITPSHLDTRIGSIPRYFDGMVTATTNSHYKGIIDELKVWNYARSVEEMRATMDCSENVNNDGSLIAYYRFDNNIQEVRRSDGRPVVYDSSGNEYHGVMEGYVNGSEVYTDGIALCTYCNGDND